nr:MAG TPA: hypothetical protein [Caudoviricetes sp.]
MSSHCCLSVGYELFQHTCNYTCAVSYLRIIDLCLW